MSDFIVSEAHINAIVNYVNAVLAPKHGGTYVNMPPEELGQLLWDENLKSVGYRYDRRPTPLKFNWYPNYYRKYISAVQMLKALRCLDYQSCEHPDYKSSDAHKAIEEMVVLTLLELPGYEEADWEIT